MVKINKSVVENAPLLLPKKHEQLLISEVISTWGNAIATTEKLIENSEAQKNALMQQFLGENIDVGSGSVVSREYALEEIVTERTEGGVNGLPLLSITQSNGIVDQSSVGRKNSSSHDKSRYRHIYPGDIGYNTMQMWQGVSALSHKEGVVSPAYTVLKVNPDFDALYLSFLFKFSRTVHELYKHSQGLVSDTWNLKYRYLKTIKVKMPDFDEQKRVASILLQADMLTIDLQRSLELLVEERSCLLQNLLTGIRRIKLDDSVF